jgi:DNA-binding NarL/FixJ family response regulator
MNRRNCEIVDEAHNRLKAVHKVEVRQEGYNIIFIDITMPILDRFGALRQIRAIEETRRKRAKRSTRLGRRDLSLDSARNNLEAVPRAQPQTKTAGAQNPALIIAFTRHFSIDHQTEALRIGIDLFITKSMAFKKVRKIIDN